tara:strand:+ start:391 stop:621 length:231 start_codon:yes stop_codon:yes gene_type:complete
MEYYLSNNDINEAGLYIKYRIELISNRKGKIIPLGDAIAKDNEEERLREIKHFFEWMQKASEMDYDQVSVVFEKKS